MEWLTVKDVEDRVKIPNATIRRYIRSHGYNLKIKKQNQSWLIAEDSVDVLVKIRDLYAKGKTAEQVSETLARDGIPMTITVDDGDEHTTVQVAEALVQLKESMNEQMNTLKDELVKQQEFNKALLQKLNERSTRDDERDRKLTEALRSIQEVKQIAAAEEETKEKTFWQRLFNK